jgi:hypothetical protein
VNGYPYTFQRNPLDLGQGSRGLGFVVDRGDVPRTAWNAGGAPTRRQLHTLQPAQVFAPQTVTDVSLRGNGVYLAGQVTLQALNDYNKNGGQ